MYSLDIIVPVYNGEKTLDRCIKSLVNQTYNNINIIIVDDGSSDSSFIKLRYYAEKDNRVKVFHCENHGVSYARNFGLRKSKSDYICFVDCDDYLKSDFLEKIMHKMVGKNIDIGIAGFSIVQDGKSEDYKSGFKERIYDSNSARKMILSDESPFTWSVWGKIFKRSIVIDVFFDEKVFYGEDLMFIWQVFSKDVKIMYIPIFGYQYIQNPESAMHDSFSAKKMSLLKVFDFMLESMNKNEDIKLMNKILEKKYFYVLSYIIEIVRSNRNKYQAEYDFLKKELDGITLGVFLGIPLKKKIMFFLVYFFDGVLEKFISQNANKNCL